jgi:hypothetical protein
MQYLPNSLRERLSQSILLFVEKHPKLHSRVFDYIRDLKERLKEDATKFQITSKRPHNNDLEIHSFFIYDIFFTDNFKSLEKGLDKIYQHRSSFIFQRDINAYKDFINKTAPSLLSSGAYLNLPLLSSTQNRYFPPGISLDVFPEGIKYIHLQLSKILPSYIILFAQIILDEKIILDIDGFIDGYFEGKVILNSLKYRKFGYSSTFSEIEKKKAIKCFITEIKSRVETFLAKYFRGFFLSAEQKCPSIEVYSISKLEISEDLIHLRSSDKDFWRILGFDWPFQRMIFINPPFTFFYDHDSKINSSHKLIVDKKQIDTNFYGSIDGAIIMKSRDLISEYIRSFSFIEIINHFLNKGMRLNLWMENIINKNPKRKLRTIIKLQQEIFKNCSKMDKFIDEYEGLMSRMPNYWKKDQFELSEKVKNSKLTDFLTDVIDFRKNSLHNRYKLISSHADRFLESKNIQVNYSLQISLRILSFILLIVAIIQIVIALKIDFSDLLRNIVSIWNRLFSRMT